MANTFKKSIAMLLALFMLTGTVPVQALAEETEPGLTVTMVVYDNLSSRSAEPSGDEPLPGSDPAPDGDPAPNGDPAPDGDPAPVSMEEPKYDSELTTGENIVETKGEVEKSETTDEEGNTVTTESQTTTTEGTVEVVGGTADIEGEETYTEITTTNPDGEEIGSYWEIEGSETIDLVTKEETGEGEQPEVTVPIVPGETTTGSAVIESTTIGDIQTSEDDKEYDYTVTTETDRTVTVEASELEATVDKMDSSLEALQPELKFDRNDAADQAEKKKETELYTDNGHFQDPDQFTVTGAPEDYPFQYVGSADYSGHYVSKVRVVYKRDEAGNPIKDENGNYVIDHLEKGNGSVILTSGGVPTTEIDGPFDQKTGTRPTMFMLKNEAGETVYGYCIDLGTPTTDKYWYQIGNLEDNDYYATEDAEEHVRGIVTNGYWGTAEGTGSIEKIREDLKKAVADGTVESEYDITFTVEVGNYKEGQELAEGEYVVGSKVYKHISEHVVLNDELIDSFTEGEAMDATQSAIWSYANGSNYALDGTDRQIVGDITYASSAWGDSLNGKNDFIGAARTKAFYMYLMQVQAAPEMETSTVVINEKNNVEDMSITVKDKVEGHEANADDNQDNDVYNTDVNFTLAFIPGADDDLLVQVTFTDLDGNEQTVTKRLAGENTEGRFYDDVEVAEDGSYVISGLQLSENQDWGFDLRLEGTQHLENGVYIYTAKGGINNSQSMVGMAQGVNTVDVTVGMTIKFDVDENNHVVAERHWHKDNDPTNDFSEKGEEEDNAPPAKYRVTRGVGQLELIIDEEVPLAQPPQTGDMSMLWFAMIMLSGLGLCMLKLLEKKRGEA